MADWIKYPIKPLQHGMETDYASLYTPYGFSPGAMNVKIYQHSVEKPWGYNLDRTITEGVRNVILYTLKDGTRYTVYLTNTGAYIKTPATYSSITAAANPYTIPSGDRWWSATVDDKLCFGNSNENVQCYTGVGNASALDSTYATRARFGMAYANRLWLADLYDAGIRDPYLLRGSMEGNPTIWNDSTSADYPFIETDDVITGLGSVGYQMVVFKKESIILGSRTAQATDPLTFDIQVKGTGCIAPYSILNVMGTCAWLGRDDFYAIDAGYPKAIGEKMRYKFYDLVSETEAEKTWGFVNAWQHECIWFANTSEGQMAFVWDYKVDEWYLYSFPVTITGAGTGAV